MPYFFIPCRIERGGFSSERTFIIDDRGEKLVGTANVEYLRDARRRPLGDDQPPFDKHLDGFVQCRTIDIHDERVVVEVPSADLIRVSKDDLVAIDD